LSALESTRFECLRGTPLESDFAASVLAGLSAAPKSLECRYIYDSVGSKLFEDICGLEEYYLTRAELEILQSASGEIASRFSGALDVVELGSGSGEKTRLLLAALENEACGPRKLRYVPLDVSRTALSENAECMLAEFAGLRITAVEAEYAEGLEILGDATAARVPRLVLWLGSSVGNFERADAGAFLGLLRESLVPQDRLLIGIDLRKEAEVLEAAYDDAQGVTARFNANLLARINRELGGDFDPEAFRYEARYDMDTGSVDMCQVSLRDQEVHVAVLERSFHFAAGERIQTERSVKYSPDEIDALALAGGFARESTWLDEGGRYALNLFAPK